MVLSMLMPSFFPPPWSKSLPKKETSSPLPFFTEKVMSTSLPWLGFFGNAASVSSHAPCPGTKGWVELDVTELEVTALELEKRDFSLEERLLEDEETPPQLISAARHKITHRFLFISLGHDDVKDAAGDVDDFLDFLTFDEGFDAVVV